MKRIEATFRIITPMFLGDAEQASAELRPPSIKGALRFWWRALNWKRAMEACSHSEDEALAWLHNEEARLFGLAAKEENKKQMGGQGVFLLRITQHPRFPTPVSDWPEDPLPINGSTYLAFGITTSGSREKGNFQTHRKGIPENLSFSIELLFKPDTKEADIHSIQTALEFFGLLGGLGSRNRRALGSVTLERLNNNDYLLSKEAYKERIEALFKSHAANGSAQNYPPYTALTKLSMCCRFFDVSKNARTAHNSLGNAYKNFRGQASSLRGKDKLPFGIPLQEVSKNEERRSSPLFFHIHKVKEGFLPLAYFIPADFHPDYTVDNEAIHGFYQVVRQFMEAKA